MAEMVPDRLPSTCTRGEQRLFDALRKLPDDCIVYYEPVIGFRFPDLVVIDPTLGVLVVEVKGWRPGDILRADSNAVTLRDRGEERHPLRQARDYQHRLQDECRRSRLVRRLVVRRTGERSGRFVFPFARVAVLSNITSGQLADHPAGDLTPIFPPQQVVARDQLQAWENMTGAELRAELARYFNPTWTFPRLTEDQVRAIRAIIHPEVSLPLPPDADRLAVLDLRQERLARSIGDGHRVVYGVAGSGKTVMLLARAKIIAQQCPDAAVLVLCFNVPLAAYLRGALAEYPGVSVHHFDEWAKLNRVPRQRDRAGQVEGDELLGRRLLLHLRDGARDSRRFDAVLIDEAQDWPGVWFECARAAMRRPDDGELLIVADRRQGLRGSADFSWSSVGVKARGRTLSAALGLDRNYRNTREILELAALFAGEEAVALTDDQFDVVPVDPAKAVRSTGVRPKLVWARNRRSECEAVAGLMRRLTGLDGALFPGMSRPLDPSEIGVLYCRAFDEDRPALAEMVTAVSSFTKLIWLRENNRHRVCEPGVKVQTIHGSKGLQYPAVVLLWADQMRPTAEDVRLMYVALTRAETHLFVTHSRESELVQLMRQSGKVAAS